MENLFLIRYPEPPIPIPAKRKTSIGRSDENDIVLTEARASRRHAAIGWLRFQKSFSISDLGSSNGTYLNGAKLPSFHAHLLHDRDKIRIASAVFTVRIVDHPGVIADEFRELRDRIQYEATQIVHLNDLPGMTASADISGNLAHLCPVEIFQMLDAGTKSGTLTLLTADGEGRFSISSGKIVSAAFREKLGEHAVYEALRYNEGTFRFEQGAVPVPDGEEVLNTAFLLIEGCRMMDEALQETSGE
jgi:pSer/pThr/pTyr-binding forkhead associated (FHA) protein